MKRPEILAPAGDFACLQAAIDAGADAVYFGLGTFNMRARPGVNFTVGDLPEIGRRCRGGGGRREVKRYLTLNVLVFEGEMEEVEQTIVAAKPYVDAFIVSDWGVISLCRKHGADFHISTQMSASNSEAVRFLASQGATRVVLARECTLEEIAQIVEKLSVEKLDVEIETFVHGAQCVANSGRCFMSQELFGKSANRGECVQPCRRKYLVTAVDSAGDADGAATLELGPHTVMSARDICSLGFVDRLMDAGIASFKIEGRARNATYVKTCVEAYRAAVDAVIGGIYTPELVAALTEKVKTVFHREFSSGLSFGRPGVDQFAKSEDSLATTARRHVGVVVDYFLKAGIVQVKVQDRALRPGDPIQVHGPTTGVLELTVGEIRHDGEVPSVAEKGSWVTFACPRCRAGDKVFFVERR